MTDKDILLNFLNLGIPTIRQIIEVLKIIVKNKLKVTDDGYEINPLTGARTKKIITEPTQIDKMTDIKITVNLINAEIEKMKPALIAEIKNQIIAKKII